MGRRPAGGVVYSSTNLRAQTTSSHTSNILAVFPLETSKRTIVVLAVRSDEERGALEGCTRRAELLDPGDVGREGGRVAIGLLPRGGVDVGVHGGEAATPTMRTKRDREVVTIRKRASANRSMRVVIDARPRTRRLRA